MFCPSTHPSSRMPSKKPRMPEYVGFGPDRSAIGVAVKRIATGGIWAGGWAVGEGGGAKRTRPTMKARAMRAITRLEGGLRGSGPVIMSDPRLSFERIAQRPRRAPRASGPLQRKFDAWQN